MDLATFIHERRPQWRQLEELLRLVEGSGLATLDDTQAIAFARLYRRAASDLNQAQTYITGDTTVRYLNDLVARAYLIIYARNRTHILSTLAALCRDYPKVFRRHFRHFLLATALLGAGALFGFVASYYDAGVARGFLLPTEMPMIQPGQERGLQSAGQLAGFSGFLFRHNVSVSLVAFALGMTFGVGTAWLMFENGIILGALAAVFLEADQFQAFLTGVLPHGVLEIPACLIGGAGGFLLAQGLLWAQPWPRREELARTGREALWLVAGCIPLLVVAALLEAVVARAPDWYVEAGVKLTVAGIFALLFLAYLLLPGWQRRGPAAPAARS
jgi:uncharacterized membrane protein SpoIIM required for sporulation